MAVKTKKRAGMIGEFWAFLKERKVWWLAPIIILLLVSAIFIIASSSTLSPFIYALF